MTDSTEDREIPIREMDFPTAIGVLFVLSASPLSTNPSHLSRRAWGKEEQVFIQYPDAGSMNTQPYFFKVFSQEDGRRCRVPWVPNQGDLFADDWVITHPTKE